MVDGIAQKPIEASSMAYTFDKANATRPRTRTTQYFEMFGNRAIYHDGWIASTTPPAAPWLMGLGKLPDVVNGYKWELYDLAKDFSQNNDLAADEPDKLQGAAGAVPGARRRSTRCSRSTTRSSTALLAPRPSVTAGRNEFTYSGEMSGTAERRRAEHR